LSADTTPIDLRDKVEYSVRSDAVEDSHKAAAELSEEGDNVENAEGHGPPGDKAGVSG
jgi:hypothetical protein